MVPATAPPRWSAGGFGGVLISCLLLGCDGPPHPTAGNLESSTGATEAPTPAFDTGVPAVAALCSDTEGRGAHIACIDHAWTAAERLEPGPGKVDRLNEIGIALRKVGQYAKALEVYDEAAELAEALHYPVGRADAFNNAGLVHRHRGEPQRALDLYAEALVTWEALGDAEAEARTLHNMGIVYSRLDSLDDAVLYLERSLQGQAAVQDRATTLIEIGSIHFRQTDLRAAERVFQQALSALTGPQDRIDRAAALDGLASVFWASGRTDEALTAYDQALQIYRHNGMAPYEGDVLANIGRLYESLGQLKEALRLSRQAIERFDLGGVRDGKAHALYICALAEQQRANLGAARRLMEEVLEIVETFRATPHRRSQFFATRHVYYELYIDLLMQLHEQQPEAGYDRLAFGALERSRARGFLAELSEERTPFFQALEPALIRQREQLRQAINAAHRQQNPLDRTDAAAQDMPAREQELRALMLQWDTLQSEIERSDPSYERQVPPEILSLEQTQQRLLDDEILLLAYSLGAQRSYLFSISVNGLETFVLPRRERVEALAVRTYRLLGEKHLEETDGLLRATAAQLSNLLLGPVASKLTTQHLMIIPDGGLQYLPFGALPKPQRTAGNERYWQASVDQPELLLVDHLVTHIPSASAAVRIEESFVDRSPAEKELAVFADPVLEVSDPRLSQPMPTAPDEGDTQPRTEIELLAESIGLQRFERLPFTAREAASILALVPTRGASAKMGFEANRQAVLDEDLSQYRILHFATHGVLHTTHPELSGIVLSSFDPRGRHRDPLLRVYEIYDLDLTADLVVLSACRTALGPELRGEGLIGLTRGFLHAGAARVLVSLWNVDDAATAILMERFYSNLLSHELAPAAALRQAQISMLDEQRWKAAYFWAGFILQGKVH